MGLSVYLSKVFEGSDQGLCALHLGLCFKLYCLESCGFGYSYIYI